jgi:transposase-like protein
MKSCRPPLFWKRKFEPQVIVTCVRWYLRFCLSLPDLEELMAERGLSVDHTSIWRWIQAYGPELYRRLQGEVKRKSSTWHMDETFVRIAGKWRYLFRAVDSQGQTVDFFLSESRDREAAKIFLKRALANPDTARHACSPETGCGAIRRRSVNSRLRVAFDGDAATELGATVTTGWNRITAT